MQNNISLEWQANKEYFPANNQSQLAYVLLEMKPRMNSRSSRRPLNLSLVLDRSGSMKGQKIVNVRKAVGRIIDQLNENDILSVVIFNDDVELLIPAQIVFDKAELKEKIDTIIHGGGTTISKGMRVGLDELNSHLDEDKINRMILLTDGQTYGDEDECCILAQEAAAQKIAVTALGVGDEWNDEMIDAIAQYSQGKSDYIENPDDIVKFFTDEVTSFQNIVVENALLTLRLVEGTQPRRIFRVSPLISDLGYSPISERDIMVELHDMTNESGQQLLVELLLPPRPEGTFRLAQAELTFDVPSEDLTQQKLRVDLTFSFTKDVVLSKGYNPELMNTVERVTAFNLQTRALDDIAAGNYTEATRRLRAAATRLLSLDEVDLANTALQEAENLENEGRLSNRGTKKLRYETRKLTRRLDSTEEFVD